MRRGGTGLALNNASAQPPPRRSSAIELSSLGYSHQHSNNNGSNGGLISNQGGATLGNNLASYSGGSRSAATSPVGGASLSSTLNLPGSSSAKEATSTSSSSGSPRHNRTSNEAWVCPNDRQLALRAKLQSGWSVKTAIMNQWKQPEPITAEEHEKIRNVVEKAAAMEKAEEERLGRLVERLESLRTSRMGNGETDCILCGEVFRFYHHSQKRCSECNKMTCGKCGRDYPLNPSHGSGSGSQQQRQSSLTSSSSMSSSLTSLITSAIMGGAGNPGDHGGDSSTIWLCKICAEQRELKKKSGAWFFKAMPKYAKPRDGGHHVRRFSHFTPLVSTSIDNLASAGGSMSGKDENSSEDEAGGLRGWRPRGSVSSAGPAFVSLPYTGNHPRFTRTESEVTDEDDALSLPSNGQSVFETDTSERLSRPRALPSSVPPTRSTSVPPPLEVSYNHIHHLHQSPSPANGFVAKCRPSSPASSIGSPVTSLPPRGPPPPPARLMSPRYFRPPPGMGPPHRGGPPPWARGFRPPFDPRFSPRGLPRRPPMRGQGFPPPRPRLPGPPRGPPGSMRPPPRGHHPFGPRGMGGSFPHSAPHSPMLSHRTLAEQPLGLYDPSGSPSPPASLPSGDLDARTADFYYEMAYDPRMVGRPPRPASTEVMPMTPDLEAIEGVVSVEDEIDEEEVPSPPSKLYSKAKPLPEKENKFTSTLRRLSTVRKRNKSKRKCKEKEATSNGSTQGDSGIEAVITPSSSHDHAIRPSSTTSKESEGEAALTSGYFRQESQSRGSDETLSSPRSPEGSYGLIEFSIAFDEPSLDLSVNVIKAKKIKGMDANGLSDSYCKVSLIPPPGGRVPSCQTTKTVAKSVNPHYNANLHFPGVTYDTLLATSIHLAILDEDLAGDHLLAEAKFALQKVLPQLQKKFQISLEKPNLKDTTTHDGLVLTSHVGRLEVSLAYYVKAGTLKVLIIKCHDLPATNEESSANPYVKAVLYPLNKSSKHQTTVKWKTVNPEFQEQFVYLTSLTELPKQSLHITVWERGKGRADEYLGGIILGMNAKGSRLQHWSDMVKYPGQAHTKTHYLSANYID